MTAEFSVNHMPVTAAYRDEDVEKIFLPLLRTLTELRRKKGSRLFVLLSAPPGAGKTTLAKFLEKLSRETPGLSPVSAAGMDGFHRYMSYLTTHTLLRDGKEVPMVNVKGSPPTFDLELLTKACEAVSQGKKDTWPDYDRMKKDPVEDGITLTGEIVLIEGNYLLLTDEGWDRLAGFADYTIRIRADADFLRGRLIRRKHATGTPLPESIAFVDYSDMVNVRTCLTRTKRADLNLFLSRSGEYSVTGAADSSDDLTARLIQEAFLRLSNSYAPYSHFNVSAAVLADSGRIYTGVNVENASYPAGICAERNAIFHAVSEGERKIRAIAIAGGPEYAIKDYCAPCGICRQVMREFADPEELTVILARSERDYRKYTLAELLPESFGPEFLS